MAKLDFEECLKRLEDAVTQLEEGELSLDASLKLFEEGIQASKQCAELLAQASAHIEQLVKESDEDFRLEPLDQ